MITFEKEQENWGTEVARELLTPSNFLVLNKIIFGNMIALISRTY